MRKILLFCLGVFIISSCEKVPDINQQVLFQIEYSNYAWGSQHIIKLIDSSGVNTVWNNPARWNIPDSKGYISLSRMNENILQPGEIICVTDKRNLEKGFSLINEAKDGELTKPETRMFDAGIVVYSGYLYYPERKMYQQVFIRQTGDAYIENTSPAAKAIYFWLSTVCAGTHPND